MKLFNRNKTNNNTKDITSGMKEWFLANETKAVVIDNHKFTVVKAFLDYVTVSDNIIELNVPYNSIKLFKVYEA